MCTGLQLFKCFLFFLPARLAALKEDAKGKNSLREVLKSSKSLQEKSKSVNVRVLFIFNGQVDQRTQKTF